MKDKITVLIAEDSKTQAVQLQYLLEGQGYATEVAENGRQALEIARKKKPALIVSDILMPELDGYGFCRAVKEDENLKEVPVILVTSLSDSEDVIRGLESGADNFIRKPYDARYLVSRIEYLLMNKELRQNQRMRLGLEIRLSGKTHFITAERQQILDLLISTYEQAIRINDELKLKERDLARSNQILNGLYRIAEGLNEAGSEKEVAETALKRAVELPSVHAGWILLLEGQSAFRIGATCNMDSEVGEGDCLCQRKLLSGELVQSANIPECENLNRVRHASIPLLVGERKIGLMNLVGEREFSENELRLLHNIGEQVAVALERARLHEKMEKLVEERTKELRFEIAARKRIEKEQQRLLAIIDSTPDFVATADPSGNFLSINRAGLAMIGDRKPENLYDIHPEWAIRIVMEEGIPHAVQFGSWSGETAFLRDGMEIPVSQVIIAHKAGGESVEYLSTVARDVSVRKAQERRIMRLNRVYAVLSGINTTIVRVKSRKALFDEACRIAAELGGFKMAWIGMLSKERIVPAAKAGDDDIEKVFSQLLNSGAMKESGIVVCNDMASDPEFSAICQEAFERGYRAFAVFPIHVGGEKVGVFVLHAGEANYFDREEMKLLVEVAGDISFGLDHLAKEEQLNYLAYYDVLTGLPNRTLFFDRLSQFLLADDQVAVLVMDLERFRIINETLGRHAGDGLLRQIAERLSAGVLEKHHFSRISADSFAAIYYGFERESDVVHFIENVQNSLSEAFRIDETELRIAARFGIALFPANGRNAETLFRNAEAALKKAKLSGDKYLFYNPEINARVAEKLTMENRLRRALEEDQFVLYYQPKVDLGSGCITALEALIRWKDPEGGLISPVKFIPLLEETGMILEVGRWALEKAVSDSLKWGESGSKSLRVAVNVSPFQLKQKDFVEKVEKAVGNWASRIDLEITESLLMQDIEENMKKLFTIREMGMEIAVDDFGTGYSSLSYIARLPVNSLKIDRSFIVNMNTSPDDFGVVSSIISLAHSLDMKVIAEGVETMGQAAQLKALECDEIQGYLFSPAVPPEQIALFLVEGKTLSSG